MKAPQMGYADLVARAPADARKELEGGVAVVGCFTEAAVEPIDRGPRQMIVAELVRTAALLGDALRDLRKPIGAAIQIIDLHHRVLRSDQGERAREVARVPVI